MTEIIPDYTSGSSTTSINPDQKIGKIDSGQYSGESPLIISAISRFFNEFSLIVENYYQIKYMSSDINLYTKLDDISCRQDYPILSDEHDAYLEAIISSIERIAEECSPYPMKMLEIFTNVVDSFIEFSSKYKRDPPISFQYLYNRLMGLSLFDIQEQTIRRITSALQWKIISSKWMDLGFWKRYYMNISNSSALDYKKAVQGLIHTLITVQGEERKQAEFNAEYRHVIEHD
ncbi:MAG: hypothetical protein Q6365_017515 [Candidatus Sigynarchaeota archaeon]